MKFFDSGYKELKRCKKIATKVVEKEAEYKKLTDAQLTAKTAEFIKRYKENETLDDLLIEAFATVREAATRVTNKTPFYVQIVGAVAIHGGNIAEMKTGEGKTLTSVMPAYLNAIAGTGVHIVTVNEYLAQREAHGEIGDLFRFLGLTVGLNIRDLTQEQKREVYDCDIMYTTNSELGFDYLRDNMVLRENQIANTRGLKYAIIDEVDSILIDEARTPLIISGGAKKTANLYAIADTFVKHLTSDDYDVDVESQTVSLNSNGIKKAEKGFKLENIYDLKHVSLIHHIDNALKANIIMKKDKQYVVDGDEVLIVDQFTGRILKGRQYSEGLHQAIEAKEGVEIKRETQTVATITYQNFFRMYSKLSGMTGTAKTEEEEFRNIYNMYVVEVPTNKPVIREDKKDLLFVTEEEKLQYLIEDVKAIHATGQPILLGTVAVESSEVISRLLTKNRLPHEVLNAKNHEREAEIIANAGKKGSITIATNMAGRGTDIKINQEVASLGGLAVLGTERHESRRIDNQLRGRSGRQGDKGSSRFYISAEDELLQRFGGDSFKNRIQTIVNLSNKSDKNATPNGLPAPLESKMFTNFVQNAQKRIEGNNFDSRKNVLKYDEVLRKQREVFYKERMEVIKSKDLKSFIEDQTFKAVLLLLTKHVKDVGRGKFEIDDEGIEKEFNKKIFPTELILTKDIKDLDENELVDYVNELAVKFIFDKQKDCPTEIFNDYLKVVSIRVLDMYWTEHIDGMSALRQGISFQGYAQTNPLVHYQSEGAEKFKKMNESIAIDILRYLSFSEIRVNENRTQETEDKRNLTTNQATDTSIKKAPAKSEKQNRNDLCACNSGKKYKDCCGLK